MSIITAIHTAEDSTCITKESNIISHVHTYVCRYTCIRTDAQTDRHGHTDMRQTVQTAAETYHKPVWCLPLCKVTGDEGGLEPTSMLIRPLQVQIRHTSMVWGGQDTAAL